MSKLVCEIVSKLALDSSSSSSSSNSSTRLYGLCVDSAAAAYSATHFIPTSRNAPLAVTNFKKLEQFFRSRAIVHNGRLLSSNNSPTWTKSTPSPVQRLDYDEPGAALFIVVVILFYSLTIALMIVSNIKCKLVVISMPGGGCSRARACRNQHLYDSQRQETKEAIEMLFAESPRTLTSVALATEVIAKRSLNNSPIYNNKNNNNNCTTESSFIV